MNPAALGDASAHRYNDRPVNRILYLSRAEVERLLDVDALLDALARALVSFSAGTTSVPPRMVARVLDRGLMGAMVGYVPGSGLEAKLVSVFPQNDQRGVLQRSEQRLVIRPARGPGATLSPARHGELLV